MKRRKVIQISAVYSHECGTEIIIALCDDGTMWSGPHGALPVWIQIEPISQDDEETTTKELGNEDNKTE